MLIEIYKDNKSIKVTREVFEPGAANAESLVDAMITSPNKPANFDLASPDAIEDISHGMFDGRVCVVDFVIDGEPSSVTINEENIFRYNRGLPVLLVSC